MIQMINNKVLINPDDIKETTDSGIIITNQEVEMQNKGIVASVGNKVKELKKGDYVVYQPRHAMRITHEEKDYLIFPESSILAKIEQDSI